MSRKKNESEIDYSKAVKLYKSLNCPENTLDVIGEVLSNEQAWNIILSIRSRGKTTNMLLWAMCLNACYGIQIQYIRQRDYQLTPKQSGTLFDVILQCHYIEIITKGRYNNIFYRGRKWYYQKIDEEGNPLERSEEPFCYSLAIDKHLDYKSVYNAPKGDIIIFDEFLNTDGYLEDEFYKLNDLLSTIIRERTTAHIYLLGNLVDRFSPYFDELCLNDIIAEMTYGDHRQLATGGTHVHIYMMPKADYVKRQKVNEKYFSWLNPKINAITGSKGLWAMKLYPKPPKGKYKLLSRAYFFKNGKYLARELRLDETTNLLYVFFFVDDYGYDPERHILYSCNSEIGYNQMIRYGLGYTKTDQAIKKLIQVHRDYYKDNTAGTLLESYLRDM